MKSYSNDVITPEQLQRVIDKQDAAKTLQKTTESKIDTLTKIAVIALALVSITLVAVVVGVAKLFSLI